jgi:HEAT repeat protein
MTTTSGAEQLKDKFDSLFVIASSGEVQFREMVEPAKDSLAAMGVDVVPLLIDKFTTKSARERWTVIHVLKRIGSPAVPYLVRALKRADGLVVQRVCWALGDIADSAAVDPLIEVRHHPRWQVRDQAIGALGKIGARRAGEVTIEALTDSIGQVRKAAAVSCGKLAAHDGVARLVHMLGDDFYGARMSALEALLKLDTTRVVTTVVDSVSSVSDLVGDLGCRIMGRLGTPECLDALWDQTQTDDPARRAHAAVALLSSVGDDAQIVGQFFAEREQDRLARLKISSAADALSNEQ